MSIENFHDLNRCSISPVRQLLPSAVVYALVFHLRSTAGQALTLVELEGAQQAVRLRIVPPSSAGQISEVARRYGETLRPDSAYNFANIVHLALEPEIQAVKVVEPGIRRKGAVVGLESATP